MRWLVLFVLVARVAAADELASKADEFRSALHARHLSREGLVLYNVHLPAIAHQIASGAYPAAADGPTFNGLLAGAACARAESSSGAERDRALGEASAALSGLEILMDVTGIRGLM